MQKKLKIKLFTFVLLIILGLTFQPAISTYAACPDDIFFYLKLDEPTPGAPNGTYVDFIKDNDGTGNANPTAVTGRVNGAQEFNGTDTGIDVPADRRFDWAVDESFSIEFWVKRNGAVTAEQVAIGRDDPATSLSWWAGIDPAANTASFTLIDSDGPGANPIPILNGATDITDDVWHHVVAVRDRSAGANGQNLLYVDGQLDAAPLDAAYDAGFGSTADLSIGYYNLNLTPSFHFGGMIDEVALYNRALTPAEIQDHFDDGQAGQDYCMGSAPFVPFPDDTISLWQLDETPSAANAIYMDSFDGNDGAGNPNPTAVPGRVNGAQEFNGTDTEINVPADNSFDWAVDESFSIEFWVKRNGAVTVEQVAIGRDDPTTSLSWWAGIDPAANTASFTLIDSDGPGANPIPILNGATDITDDVWHHVVAVRDRSAGANGQNLLYVDGQLDAAPLDAAYDAGFGSTADLSIGYYNLNLTPSFHFGGMIDEVALYDRALTPAEIQAHYNAGLAGNGVQTLRPPPVANAGADPTNPKETTMVTLDGTGSTPGYVGADAAIASYFWEQTDGTPLVTLSDDTVAQPTFTAPDVAAAGMDLTFQLTVTAEDGQSSDPPATVIVSVVDRIPPVADAGPDQPNVTEGDTVTLNGTGSDDADGTITAYLWEEVTTTGVTINNAASATASFTAPDVAAAGETLTFRLTVTDDDGLTDDDTVDVIVADASSPAEPVADAGADQTVAPGAAVTLDGSASTPATGLTYAWSQTAGTLVQLAGDDTAAPTFTAPTAVDISAAVLDTLTFQLTVTDASGSNTDTVDVIVDNSVGRSSGGGGGGGCFINSMF